MILLLLLAVGVGHSGKDSRAWFKGHKVRHWEMKAICVLLVIPLIVKVVIFGSLHLLKPGVDCCLTTSEDSAVCRAVRLSQAQGSKPPSAEHISEMLLGLLVPDVFSSIIYLVSQYFSSVRYRRMVVGGC